MWAKASRLAEAGRVRLDLGLEAGRAALGPLKVSTPGSQHCGRGVARGRRDFAAVTQSRVLRWEVALD